MLGVSRPIYVAVDSPNLGFPYFNFLGGYQLKKHPVYELFPSCDTTKYLTTSYEASLTLPPPPQGCQQLLWRRRAGSFLWLFSSSSSNSCCSLHVFKSVNQIWVKWPSWKCHNSQTPPNITFSMKMYLKKKPFKAITCVTCLNWV